MIKADASGMEEYLVEYERLFREKAEEAFREFAKRSVTALVRITPRGDSVYWAELYAQRHDRDNRYPLEEGMLKANWDISLNGSPEQLDYVSGSSQGERSLYDTYKQMQSFKLGDKFTFYNITPYNQRIPEGKAEDALTAIYMNSNINELMK